MGIASTGSSLGGIVLAIQLRRQFVTVGFPWAVRTSAFICLALLAAANLCLRTRLPPKRGGKVVDFSVYRDKPYAVWCGANFAIFLGVCAAIRYVSRTRKLNFRAQLHPALPVRRLCSGPRSRSGPRILLYRHRTSRQHRRSPLAHVCVAQTDLTLGFLQQ